MPDQTITCPQCGKIIELTDALTGQIKDQLKSEMQKEVNRKEAEIKAKEDEMHKKEQALAESEKNIDEQVSKKPRKRKSKTLGSSTSKSQRKARQRND